MTCLYASKRIWPPMPPVHLLTLRFWPSGPGAVLVWPASRRTLCMVSVQEHQGLFPRSCELCHKNGPDNGLLWPQYEPSKSKAPLLTHQRHQEASLPRLSLRAEPAGLFLAQEARWLRRQLASTANYNGVSPLLATRSVGHNLAQQVAVCAFERSKPRGLSV